MLRGFALATLLALAVTWRRAVHSSMQGSDTAPAQTAIKFLSKSIDGDTVQATAVASENGSAITFQQAVDLFKSQDTSGEGFRHEFVTFLRNVPFEAFFWECRPVDSARAGHQAFEFIVKRTHSLDSTSPADFDSFRTNFKASAMAVAFPNLGRDAVLVAPVPKDTTNSWAHLAVFVRRVPHEHVSAVFQRMGEAVAERLASDASPLWLSTSGTGVNFLHIRLDKFPKYYSHRPYIKFT